MFRHKRVIATRTQERQPSNLFRIRPIPNVASLSSVLLSAVVSLALAGASVAEEAASASAEGTLVDAATRPHDLSPWGMFMSADQVVKAVIIGLVVASVVTWTIWLVKTIEIMIAKRKARSALRKLAAAGAMAEIGPIPSPGAEFIAAAAAELRLSADTVDKDGIKERIASRLDRIEAAFGRRIGRATGVLATIGATAPFVGLSGTVWGIMNSFIGISKAHTTNLAVVAPGIAEALLATAFGLAAAIPAVVIYNVFARSIAGYRAQLGDASAEVLRLVSRDLDRPAVTRRPMRAAAE
jgi:biopolymer transport protein ExbB